MPRALRIVLWVVLALSLLLAVAERFVAAVLSESRWFERVPSPDGAHEVVRGVHSFFLDDYTTLWLTARGEQDPARWHLIAPEVDGSYDAEWLGPTDLLITDYFSQRRNDPYEVRTIGEVRVETRRSPKQFTVDSPDGLHRLDAWTYEDSRGRQAGARLVTNWNNPERGSIELCCVGPWLVQGRWLANDHLDLQVEAKGATPPIPASWRGIRITIGGN